MVKLFLEDVVSAPSKGESPVLGKKKPTRVFLCDALAKLLDSLCYFTLERLVNPVSTEMICFKQVPIPIFHQAGIIRVRQMILWMVAEGLDAVNVTEGGRFRHMP